MKHHYFLADVRRLWKSYEVYAAIFGVAVTLFFSMESRELKNLLIRGAERADEEMYPNREWGDYDIIVSSQQGASKIKVFRWLSPNIFHCKSTTESLSLFL